MSIIVGVRKAGEIVIAADTQFIFGESQHISRANHVASKILKMGDSYVGQVGWGVYQHMLEAYCQQHGAPVLHTELEIFTFFMNFWHAACKDYSFVNSQSGRNQESPFAELDSHFLVVNATGLYRIAGNMSVSSYQQYIAIGCGADYALGALSALWDRCPQLSARELARAGCEAAIEFEAGCGAPIESYSFTGASKANGLDLTVNVPSVFVADGLCIGGPDD